MNIITDEERTRARDFLLELKKKIDKEGVYKLIHVPKMVLHNEITNIDEEYLDSFYIATRNNFDRIKTILSIKDYTDNTVYRLHNDFDHWNINHVESNQEIVVDGKSYSIVCLSVCCPINNSFLYDTPEDKVSKLIHCQLLEGNADDRFRVISGLTLENYEGVIKHNGTIIKPEDIDPFFAFTRTMISSYKNNSRGLRREVQGMVASIKSYKNNCILYKEARGDYTLTSIGNFNKIKRTNPNRVSDYYPTFDRKHMLEFLENIEIPIEELDVIACGLGSAGSAILDNLRRSIFFTRYLLIDYDKVDQHNLSNQIYERYSINNYKSDCMRDYIHSTLTRLVDSTSINSIKSRFQDVDFRYYKTKYIISGFDSIKARVELLDYILTGKIKAEYLIDSRYIASEVSNYFIDLSKPEEVEYYKKLLLQDAEEFNEVEVQFEEWTMEDVKELFAKYNIVGGHCAETSRKIFGENKGCAVHVSCGTPGCMRQWLDRLNNEKILKDKYLTQQEESACIKYNNIAIYRLAGAYIFSAIKELETGSKVKLWTHIEQQAEGIPTTVVVRK